MNLIRKKGRGTCFPSDNIHIFLAEINKVSMTIDRRYMSSKNRLLFSSEDILFSEQ